MPVNAREITELLIETAATFRALKDLDAADSQARRAAFEAYEDVLLLIGSHAVSNYEGRTALLTGLIAELSEFNRSIQVQNPIREHVDQLTGIVEKAHELFKKEKKVANS